MTDKFKILFLITKSEVGGAQKYVKEQMDICRDAAHVYLATNMPGWLSEQTGSYAADILFDNRIESRLSPGFLIALTKFIKKNKIDLIVCNSANGGLYGRLSALWCGIPAIYVSHGWSSVYNGGKLAFLLNRIEKWLAFVQGKVLCVSEADYRIAREKIGIAEHRLVLLRNNIFPVKTSKQPLTYDGGKLRLLALARFAHPKRMDLLLDTASQLDYIDVHIFGDGPEFSAVQAEVKARNIDNIILHGEVKNFNDFNSYHAFILLSDSEGLPMSALEAISAGMPSILSNVGGCKELVENGDLLVENNVASVTNALQLLKTSFPLYQQSMKPFFDKNFNLAERAAFFIDLYRSLIKK
ncbi:Glycosyltransferase involved in cell wall bisynthesis [Chitinophaga sp. YR627]|uniref:glycosyltransferase n=1 Tax=Chitinophaga sp. YR627 TaxID=1881041 RepID=UPI0008F142B1|nr:glycosyltransferase [Chitinophaga sp. YR627]SFN92088.1 Glycosyltransferase involved in cell wall bisynthesis [Chitinophaga sp. YR627]